MTIGIIDPDTAKSKDLINSVQINTILPSKTVTPQNII